MSTKHTQEMTLTLEGLTVVGTFVPFTVGEHVARHAALDRYYRDVEVSYIVVREATFDEYLAQFDAALQAKVRQDVVSHGRLPYFYAVHMD